MLVMMIIVILAKGVHQLLLSLSIQLVPIINFFFQRKEATRRRKPEEHYPGKKIKDRKVLILPFFL